MWLTIHGVRTPYVAQGRVVVVQERSVYIDCRGTGMPTVVFESGMGDGAGGWTDVHDEVAAVTRACVHDRPGRGPSEPRDRHTLADAAESLRMVLHAAGESGPFLVVGHSLGGAYARVFADTHRDEVTGLVLVDAFSPDLQDLAVHPLLGDLRTEYEAGLDRLRVLVADVEALDWPTSERQIIEADLAGLPIEVLRAPRREPRLADATNDAIEAAVIASYESLSPGRVRYSLTPGAGHIIQADRPDLVVQAVLRLVAAARIAVSCVAMDAHDVIEALGMRAHPEGGWYVETWRAPAADGGRPAGSAILYLLASGERSHWHRVDAAEIWQWSGGDALELRIWAEADAHITTVRLGGALGDGERPQAVVPAGSWQAARPLGAWALTGCIVTPAFTFDGFELALPGWEPPPET